MELQLKLPPGAEGLAEKLLLGQNLLPAGETLPLEGGMGLGDEDRECRREAGPAVLLAYLLPGLGQELTDSLDILGGLRGKAEHEVELEGRPAVPEGQIHGGVDLFSVHTLVDDPAQSFAARLGNDGEPGLAGAADQVEHELANLPGSEGGKADADAEGAEVIREPLHEPLEPRVIRGAQGGEGELLETLPPDRLLNIGEERLGLTDPEGVVEDRRLAEATLLGTSPGDLDAETVEDGLPVGNQRTLREGGILEVRQKGLGDGDPLRDQEGSPASPFDQAGGVEASAGGQTPDLFAPSHPLPLPEGQVVHGGEEARLAVSQVEEVDEPRHRLGVEDGYPSGHDQGVLITSLLPQEGDSPQVEDLEKVRIGQLRVEGEADQIELPQGGSALQGEEGVPLFAEGRLQVLGGSVDPFRRNPGAPVQGVVEEGQAHGAHPDGVEVRVGEQNPVGTSVTAKTGGDHVSFAAQVAGGAFDSFQEGEVCHCPAYFFIWIPSMIPIMMKRVRREEPP